MSENTKPSKISWYYKFIIFLIILVMMSLTTAMGYFCYMQKRSEDQKLTALNNKLAVLELNLKQDDAKLADLENKIGELNNRYADIMQDKNTVIIFQLNQLIRLANQSLVVYKDISGALELLHHAFTVIVTNDAEFVEIKYALSADIAKLEQHNSVDIVSLSAKLDAIANGVSNLRITPKAQVRAVTTADAGAWNKFLTNLKDSLFGLISISKNGAATILLPQQYQAEIESIKLDLVTAKMALLQQNQSSWNYALGHVVQIIATNFTANPESKRLEEAVIQLQKVDITMGDVNIDDTLMSLNKLNQLQ